MKRFVPARLLLALPRMGKLQTKAYASIAIVLLTSCMTPDQVRWDARKMREQVMIYYNDEIMDNLIRQKDGLPFVHVDISTVTAIATSQISGTVGAGESRTNASVSGVIGTVTRTVMRPFAYSVTPQRGDSLTITAAPVLGSAGSVNIYEPYQRFKKFLEKKNRSLAYSPGLMPPSESEYVPGTLKRHGNGYYYIRSEDEEKKAYYELCINLFMQVRPKASLKTLEETRDAAERVQGLQALPPPPR